MEKSLIINDIPVSVVGDITEAEIKNAVSCVQKDWERKDKQILRVELSVEGNEIVAKAIEKSPIMRVRRITGYLSCLPNFNNAKREECSQRICHL